MTVIDLLNKIANGEEVPKEIEVGLHHFIYENNGEYYNVDDPCDLLFDFDDDYQLKTCLNQTVYPITYDEEKEIPKKLGTYTITDETISGMRKSLNTMINIDIIGTINEIIDYLKSKGD